MLQTYVEKILKAPVYDVAIESPIDEMGFLSERFGNRILIKREDLQPVFSFKLRGAYNKMSKLTTQQLECGVITASAGNHAQGVALAGKKLGIQPLIVMPVTTPPIKVDSVKARGAKVLLHGDTYDEASEHSKKLAKEKDMTHVHPFDDPDVIVGQGTVGMEILRQVTGPLDVVFVPVGGGGLLAGVAAYIKYVRPEVKVIGVEAEDSACMKWALEKDRRIILPEVGLFADGVAVAQAGEETFKIIRECVDEVITVSTDEICAAVKDIFNDTRSIAEPAGALATAGLKNYILREDIKGQTLLTIDSGANVNFDRLRHIAERAELGEKNEAIFAVTIPEQAGSFRVFCDALGKRNITEFNYRYADAADAHVFVGVQLSGGDAEREEIVGGLVEKAYPVTDMTDNEMAKLHVRHLMGGHAPVGTEEAIFRFEFPERPGALMKFLKTLGQRWNISLFHYRNHGAAYGRVMVGFHIHKDEQKLAHAFFDKIGYRYKEETDNPAYQAFLG
jgi:threonine dehydratase